MQRSCKSKNKKKPLKAKPDGLKPTAITWKIKLQVLKPKKFLKALPDNFKPKAIKR